MLEMRSLVLPLKEESKDTKPQHGLGGNSTYSTKPKCGAKTRAGGGHPCRRVAGHGTNHLGMGRCKYHGGATPILHGLYSKVVPANRLNSYQEALASSDPKSMLEHLALLDGVIIPAALERSEGAPSGPGQTDPLDLQLKAIDIKSKVVKRLHDMEDSRKIQFTEAELRLLIQQMVAIVAEFVDADTLRKISARIGVRAPSIEAD